MINKLTVLSLLIICVMLFISCDSTKTEITDPEKTVATPTATDTTTSKDTLEGTIPNPSTSETGEITLEPDETDGTVTVTPTKKPDVGPDKTETPTIGGKTEEPSETDSPVEPPRTETPSSKETETPPVAPPTNSTDSDKTPVAPSDPTEIPDKTPEAPPVDSEETPTAPEETKKPNYGFELPPDPLN